MLDWTKITSYATLVKNILERLFDGFAIGLLPAIGIFTLANRLMPLSTQERGAIEILVFHSAWIAIGLLILSTGTSNTHRRVMTVGSVAMLGIVPILDGVLLNIWSWQTSSWIVPSVAITNILLLTLTLGFSASWIFGSWRKKMIVNFQLTKEDKKRKT